MKVVKDAWRTRKVVSILCLDVKAAFPSVDLDHLYHDMRMKGVPVQLTDWLRRCFAGRRACIKFDNYESEPFDVLGGLDQGDPISLPAYDIYNAGLAEIPKEAKGEHGVMFVDDDTVMTVAEDFKRAHGKIAKVFGRREGIGGWTTDHNATFGPAKFQLADVSREREPHPFLLGHTIPLRRFPLKLGGHTIQSSTSVKLLGVYLDRDMRWKGQAASALAKGQAWLSKYARFARTRGIGPGQMRQLYLAVCVPAMLYAADVFMNPPASNRRPGRKPQEVGILKKLRTIQRRGHRDHRGSALNPNGRA
jgi:hypothetical protein